MLKQLKCNVLFGDPVSTVSRLFPDSFGFWKIYSGFLAPNISMLSVHQTSFYTCSLPSCFAFRALLIRLISRCLNLYWLSFHVSYPLLSLQSAQSSDCFQLVHPRGLPRTFPLELVEGRHLTIPQGGSSLAVQRTPESPARCALESSLAVAPLYRYIHLLP